MSAVATLADPGGNQNPRIFTFPAYVNSAGPAVVDLAKMAGLVLDPWQQNYLTAGLGETADGRWASLHVASVVPRQNGKNAAMEARQLAGLFLFEEDLQIHTAHLSDTANVQFDRMVGLIEKTPEFDKRVKRVRRGKGSEEIELHKHPKTGKAPKLRFRTRTGGGGLGFSCDTLYLDESHVLPEAFYGSLIPILSARSIQGNPQVWYACSAVDEERHEHGMVMSRIRVRGIAGGSNTTYLEFSLDRDSPDDLTEEAARDPENWRFVNPAYGSRIAPDFIAGELDGNSLRAFGVERLGVGAWFDVSANAGRIITKEQWDAAACLDETQTITSNRTFAVDMSPSRGWTSIASAGKRPDGFWHVALVDRRRRNDWVVARAAELYAEFRCPFVIDNGGPAKNLIGPFEEAGIEVVEADTKDYGVATANFYDFVVSGGVRYPSPQPELSDAVNDARKAKMGDSWKWDRLNSTSADISPLVAATLALWGASTSAPQYTNVIIAEDDEEPMEFGAQTPEVLSQADVTSCFACRTGFCPLHSQGREA